MDLKNQTKQLPSMGEFRQWYYESLSQNYSKFFNFFYENNDIFNFISHEDERELHSQYMQETYQYQNQLANCTFGTFFGVLFTDQVIFRYAFPNFRINGLRMILFMTKYIGLPLLGYGFGQSYYKEQCDENFKQIAEKYSFNYQDYNRAMDVFERAERVGRLQELLEKRNQFDWSDVPNFKSKFPQANE